MVLSIGSEIAGWFTNMIRTFFFSIDSIIYNAIEKVYDLFEVIATTTIMSQDTIASLGDRIYDLLAIFMIFKVTLSLITYVVSPNSFNDGKTGIGALTRNVVLVLALLVLVPYAFNLAFKAQKVVLADNIIPKLIFGDKTTNGSITNAGEKMAFIGMSAFIYPDSSVVTDCADLVVNGKINDKCSGWTDNNTTDGKITSDVKEAPYKSLGEVSSALTNDDKNQSVFTGKDIGNYVTGFNESSFDLAYRTKLVTAKTVEGNYVFNYSLLLSTVVGVIILLLLINFCMDIAVRSIKLSFLQLIAPVPVISFIDPKSGKDGMFKKWYQMCFSTYLSLFIRLFIIYFVIYIINLIGDSNLTNVVTGEQVTGFWLKLFMMIGALMFAKQMPKILEGLGIKMDSGGFTLNPLKKVEKDSLGGKQLVGGAKGLAATLGAAGLAGGVNFASRALNKDTWNKGFLRGAGKSVGSAIGGFTSAGFRGVRKTAKGEKMGKVFTDSYGEAMFAKLQREDLTRKGSTLPGRIKSDFNRFTGNLNAAQQQSLDIARLEAEKKYESENLASEKRQMLLEKNQKLKIHNDNSANLAAIKDKVATAKFTGINGEFYNVKDRQDVVDNLTANGKFYAEVGSDVYAKVGDTISYERKLTKEDVINGATISEKKDGKIYVRKATEKDVERGAKIIVKTKATEEDVRRGTTRKATKEDVANLVLTVKGTDADKNLKNEQKKVLAYLKENDEETKTRMKYLNESEIDLSNVDSLSEIKTLIGGEATKIGAINAEYYEREEQAKAAEEDLENKYAKLIEEASAGKTANEADNASRWVNTPQQPGWMPTPENVDPTSYTRSYTLQGAPDISDEPHHRPHSGQPPRR